MLMRVSRAAISALVIISRRLARLWPDQSGDCSQARGSWVFADPRNEIRKDHDLQGGVQSLGGRRGWDLRSN
jgi:hypothetical protein